MIDKNFYNRVFSRSERYNCYYRESPDYRLGLWPVVVARLDYNESVLEIGCGTGQFAEMLRDADVCKDYVGIDYSDVAIKKANKLGGKFKFMCCDLNDDIDFLNDYSPSVIIALETLEHLDDDMGVIKKLKPNTRFIFSVPNFPAPQHYRCFCDFDEIKNRYGELIEINYTRSFGGKDKIFLCDGYLK